MIFNYLYLDLRNKNSDFLLKLISVLCTVFLLLFSSICNLFSTVTFLDEEQGAQIARGSCQEQGYKGLGKEGQR